MFGLEVNPILNSKVHSHSFSGCGLECVKFPLNGILMDFQTHTKAMFGKPLRKYFCQRTRILVFAFILLLFIGFALDRIHSISNCIPNVH